MLLPYKQYPVSAPVISLNGRANRPKPVVMVTVIGPGGSAVQEALLDTGADDTVFPDDVAAKIGLDLSAAPTRSAAGVGMTPYPLRYAQVTLRLTDGIEYREWPAWVAFTPARLRFAGCLQFFTAAFDGEREQVTLAVTARYPGG
ncbi:MAG: aspartyl protease family protein [Gemmataceae bacterium]